jgi:hypothetical protein
MAVTGVPSLVTGSWTPLNRLYPGSIDTVRAPFPFGLTMAIPFSNLRR